MTRTEFYEMMVADPDLGLTKRHFCYCGYSFQPSHPEFPVFVTALTMNVYLPFRYKERDIILFEHDTIGLGRPTYHLNI